MLFEAQQQNTMLTLGLKLQRQSQQVEWFRQKANDVKTLLDFLSYNVLDSTVFYQQDAFPSTLFISAIK